MRIRVLALLITIFSLNTVYSQELSFVWEPFLHQWEEGVDPVELVALNGYVTWRLFVQIDGDTGVPGEPEVFSAVAGTGDDCGSDLLPVSILFEPSAELLALNADTCCIFQHPAGSVVGEGINEALCGFFPDLCYDSWVSCGAANSADAGGTLCNTIADIAQPWMNNFETCETQGVLINTCTGGAWFTLFDDSNEATQFDENNQLLIGQFTVAIGCELNEGSMCVQYFIDNDQENTNVVCLEFDQPSACFNSPIFSSITNLTDTLSCTGDLDGEIEFTFNGGSDNLSAFLYDSNDVLLQGPITGTDPDTNDGTFSDLEAGTYYIVIEDNINFDIDGVTPCESRIDDLIIYEAPELISLSFQVLQDVACAGLNQGEIQIVISGGLEPYSEPTCSFGGFTVTEISSNTFIYSNLDSSIGGIDFSVTDTLGCLAQINVPSLGAEDALVVDIDNINDISCAGENDGFINLSIESIGTPVVTWTSSGTLANENAEDQEDLGPGWYVFAVDDGLSCIFESDTIFMTDPENIVILNATPSLIECFGECNSTIDFTVTGGTGETTAQFFQVSSGLQENGSLCSEETGLTVTDENGCSATVNVLVPQVDEILLNETFTNVSCPDGCDGTICITSEGGIGNINVVIDPPAVFNETDSCFIDLCAGSYILTATDEVGCTITRNIVISQPNPFIVNNTTTNITCNGDCDGSVLGTGITGGTAPYEFSLDNGSETIVNDTLEFNNLCPGNYLFSFIDADGCTFSEADPIIITEPGELSIDSLTTISAGCGGENTAFAEATISGGTAPIIPFWNGDEAFLNSEFMTSADDLLDGENQISLEDGNGCSLDSIFEIIGTDELTIVINSSNVTCTGMCDGAQTVAFLGGIEPYTSILPNISQNSVCEGDYPVFVQDAVGCIATDTIRILADSISDIEFTIFQTPVSCWNEKDGTATVAATGGFGPLSYQWNDAAFQTTATAIGLVEDFYTVTITDTVGCTFTENLVIEPTIGCFLITNAITPNGDGFNDFWILGGIEFFPEAKVEVFNRWGQRVYESQGIYTPWDGRYNNERLAIADYYYVITFDTDSTPITGTVTIKY